MCSGYDDGRCETKKGNLLNIVSRKKKEEKKRNAERKMAI